MGIGPKRYHSGQMVMLDRGLYRIMKSEAIAYDVFMGPRCSLTNAEAVGSTSLELTGVEDGISTIPAETRILIGGREARESLEVVTTTLDHYTLRGVCVFLPCCYKFQYYA